VFPGIDPMPVRLGDRVRVRMGNLTMTNHPIHLHGHHFSVSCMDAGWVPESAQWPESTVDVPVGTIRAFDMVADNPGDWAFHCHKTHHAMNAMGHNLKNFIGVQKHDVARQIRKLVPDYMPMGSDGMAAMGEMEMPMPDNTLPMMTGFGQFGPIEMGGMFTLMKIREGLAANDYKDPASHTKSQARPRPVAGPPPSRMAAPRRSDLEITTRDTARSSSPDGRFKTSLISPSSRRRGQVERRNVLRKAG
jgi:hypothetical protein